MPTAQDIFPKIGGDPLYFSEANRFARAGGFYHTGSTLLISSGGGVQFGIVTGKILGSILISGATLSENSTVLGTIKHTAGDASDSLALVISGLQGNQFVTAGSNITATTRACTFIAHLGSINTNYAYLTALNTGVNNVDFSQANAKFGAKSFDNFTTGSPFIIAFVNTYNSTGSSQAFWNFQTFRGAV